MFTSQGVPSKKLIKQAKLQILSHVLNHVDQEAQHFFVKILWPPLPMGNLRSSDAKKFR